MITFYPGPSKLYPEVEQYMADAFRSGMLSANHRSESFMQMLKSTIEHVRHKLDIPAGYEIYFVSSATECWEIISQSLVSEASFHIYNGAFGAKWMEYAQKLKPGSRGVSFGVDEVPSVALLENAAQEDVICVTHNETSNGTALPPSFLKELRNHTNQVVAVDATSSMAGAALPWIEADVWYASVQKCFGLPPGLGIMVVSPKAITHAFAINENKHYNSLLFVRENFLKFQTPYTPNTLAIYLLGRVMEQVGHIETVSSNIQAKADALYNRLIELGLTPVVQNPTVRSATVIAVRMEKDRLAALKHQAKQQGIILGNGYGAWKDDSFRIANFPAINPEEISTLIDFLTNFTSVS